MSGIEKLLIRGIRSFSPDAPSVIEFYTPVTIIVGHNGAGKTTIIECLKYATTGDLPPNAKGGAFVHDPKLSGEGEVKGQIRLKFRNVRGQTMVVTRSMQSTERRNGKVEQKSLEGLLVTTDPATGEQVSISTRCAELDTEIPLHLGVSRSVLENVLFCHQEEAFWPLSEPSILKRKFDEIFAATRYTRALDTLRTLRKEMTGELRMEQQRLDFLTANQEKARRVEATLGDTERRMEETRDRVARLDVQMETAAAAIARASNDLDALTALVAEAERLEHDRISTLQTRTDLLAGVPPLVGSDGELTRQLEELVVSRQNAEQETARAETDRNGLIAEIEQLTRDYSRLCMQRGTLLARQEAREQKRSDCQALLLTLLRLLGLSASEADESDIAARVEDRLQGLREQLAGLRSEAAREETHRQDALHTALARQATAEEQRRVVRRDLDAAQETLLRIDEQLAQLPGSDDVSDDEAALVTEEDALQQLRARGPTRHEHDSRLAALAAARREAEMEVDRLQGQMQMASVLAGIYGQLTLKTTESTRKSEQLERAWQETHTEMSTHPELAALLAEGDGRDATARFEAAERVLDGWMQGRMAQQRAAQGQNETMMRESAQATSRSEHTRGVLLRREADLAILQTRLTDSRQAAISLLSHDQSAIKENANSVQTIDQTGDKHMTELVPAIATMALEDLLARLEWELVRLREKETSAAVYEALRREMDCSAQCPLCERGLDDAPHVAEQLRRRLETRAGGPNGAVEKRRGVVEQLFEMLSALRPLQTECDRLCRDELPGLRAILSQSETAETETRRLAEEAQTVATRLAHEERRGLLLRRRVEEGMRVGRELRSIQHDCRGLEDDIVRAGGSLPTPGATSRDDSQESFLQGGVDRLREQMNEARERARRTQGEADRVGEEWRLREAEEARREARLLRLREQRLQRQLQRTERGRLQIQAQETRLGMSGAQEALSRLEGELARATETVAEVRRERDAWQAGARERQAVVERVLTDAQVPEMRLKALRMELDRDEDAHDAVQDTLRDIAACEMRQVRNQERLAELQQTAATHATRVAETLLRERTLRDNLRARELAQRVIQLEAELEERRKRLAGVDRDTLVAVHSRAQMGRSDLLGERAGLLGELRQLEEMGGRLRHELHTEYAQVGSDWQCQMVRVRALQLGADDLDKYARALDQAIMKYHALKMDEINAIIREIWTTTYQGADIDTVEVRADHEGTGAGNRSYNYRVVMRRGGVEMDMRGRSSAGQRVLTCLIIRLALAEVFGLHCGILALDEPTTNLDRDNIAGLAAALAAIIRSRRAQANFQLILITHDEEFVQLLGRYECAEYYWRVFKDENQHSCIERQTISGAVA